jgi:Transposase IS4
MGGGSGKDPRQVVGGVVWAKADAISRDFKRILGNQFKTAWIKGAVIQVNKKKSHPAAKRSTTYVVAKYPCEVHDGVQHYKEKELSLQTLKEKDPNAPPPAPTVPPATTTATPATTETVEAPPATNATTTPATTDETVQATATDTTNPTTTPPAGSDATTTTAATSHSSSTSSSTKVPVVTVNGRHWYEGNCNVDVNGKHSSKYWKLQDQYGRGFEFTPGCDQGPEQKFTVLDYFLAVFPRKQLQEMEERTNNILESLNPQLQPTTVGEILKFFGVLILITRFEFGKRSSLWATKGFTRLVPPANFGRVTGMSRQRFDDLLRHMVWSEQPKERPPEMSHEEWRWSLVQDFVDNFNDHREAFYFASWLICADESISRWYGLGGNWINMGLPHYVMMDRKPEHGCEIQNSCDGLSGIMMRLKLVKSAAMEAQSAEQRMAVAAAESK